MIAGSDRTCAQWVFVPYFHVMWHACPLLVAANVVGRPPSSASGSTEWEGNRQPLKWTRTWRLAASEGQAGGGPGPRNGDGKIAMRLVGRASTAAGDESSCRCSLFLGIGIPLCERDHHRPARDSRVQHVPCSSLELLKAHIAGLLDRLSRGGVKTRRLTIMA